jgi:hypothetical protein
MKKPVTPVGQPTDEQLTAHAAELVAFHTELAASAGLSEDGTTSTLSDDALGAKIDELAAARLAEVAELQTAGGASIGFADRVAAVKLVHAAEQKLAEVARFACHSCRCRAFGCDQDHRREDRRRYRA